MTSRTAAVVLFAVAVFTIPLPLLGLEGSFIPVARYGQLAGVLVALVVREGAGGMVGAIVGLMAAHALCYGGLLAGASWLASRTVLPRMSPRARIVGVTALALLLVGLASSGSLYDSQFHHSSAHATLWELYR